MKTWSRLLIGIALVAALLTFTAYTEPASAQGEIKVGAVQPITGRFAFAGVHINAGLEDALAMANEEGGIGGKKIKYIMERDLRCS